MALDQLSFLASSFQRDIDLSHYSRWKIGGTARGYCSPKDAEELRRVLAYLNRHSVPFVVVGDTTNLLFDDGGFDGIILNIGRSFSRFELKDEVVTAGAGWWVPAFVRKLSNLGLSGLEHAIGIPGTLGGLVTMNGGSQRKGVGDNIVLVRGLDRSGQDFTFNKAECAFQYRSSRIQREELIVTEVVLQLSKKNSETIRKELLSIIRSRRKKFPIKLPNCGSVFVSNPSMYEKVGPPGHAIEQAGMKGARKGEAEISPLHANFIVNRGGARCEDVLSLIWQARNEVYQRTGFLLECEVRHVGKDGVLLPAHMAAERIFGPLKERR